MSEHATTDPSRSAAIILYWEADQPDLQIIDDELWHRLQDRLQAVRAVYGATSGQRRPRGQAPELYSSYLLSGLMRCGICGARITVNASRRKKASGRVYRYAWYRCSFHTTKGPAVCPNAMSVRQDVLEAKLLEKFQNALTPNMVRYVVTAVNKTLAALCAQIPRDLAPLEQERSGTEKELSSLVEFVAKGDWSAPRLQQEIRDREERLAALDKQLETARQTTRAAPLQVHHKWVEEKLRNFHELVLHDPEGARRELRKHIEDLQVTPMPGEGNRVLKITGRAKADGLLAGQEAVRLQLVAGAGFEPATFGGCALLRRQRVDVPENVPATARNSPKTAPRQPTSKRKTPRQIRDLPRGPDSRQRLKGRCSTY